MPPDTLSDELIALLEKQRVRPDARVWLSQENWAWLSRPAESAPAAARRMPAAPAQAETAETTRSLPPATPVAESATPRSTQPSPNSPPRSAPAIPSFPAAGSSARAKPPETGAPPPPIPPVPDLSGDLAALKSIISGCTRCGLAAGRKQVVFGYGNPDARLMFIGDAPSAEEDACGEPFRGPAGELFNKILTNGMGIPREDVYLALVAKCMPPENRKPSPRETDTCMPYLKRQIELVQPEVIVTLGAVPLQRLLGVNGISRARGNWLVYEGIPVMPTLHPEYLLRVPAAKRDVWEDVQQVMARLGLKRPGG